MVTIRIKIVNNNYLLFQEVIQEVRHVIITFLTSQCRKINDGLIDLKTRPYTRQHQSRAGGQGQYGSWAGAVTEICSPISSKRPKARSDYGPTDGRTDGSNPQNQSQLEARGYSPRKRLKLLEKNVLPPERSDYGRTD